MPRIGRPAKKGIERWMREFIAEQLEDDGKGDTMNGWQALTKMMFDVAMGRKPPGIGEIEIKIRDRQEAVRFLFDRAYGKAKIHIESDNIITSSPLVNINTDALDARELDALERYVEGIANKLTAQAVAVAMADEVIDEVERVDPSAEELDAMALAEHGEASE